MKKILLLLLLIFVTGCTVEETKPEENQQERDREILQDYVRSQLNTTEDLEDVTNDTPKEPEKKQEETLPPMDEIDVDEINEVEEELDIAVIGVEVEGESNFDLDDKDEEVTFIVQLDVKGLEDGNTFIVEVEALRRGGIVDTCSFLYTVGEQGENECNMDDFENYGDHDIRIFADEKGKYIDEEVTLNNNFLLSEFELEE